MAFIAGEDSVKYLSHMIAFFSKHGERDVCVRFQGGTMICVKYQSFLYFIIFFLDEGKLVDKTFKNTLSSKWSICTVN